MRVPKLSCLILLSVIFFHSCRETVREEKVIRETEEVKEIEVDGVDKEEGILEETGEEIDKEVNEEVNEEINQIGDDN